MRNKIQIIAALLACLAVSACATTLYGNQSSGGGSTTTVTSSRVVASASSSNVRVGFVSGPRIPASAPGGQVTVTSSSGGALAGIILFGLLAGYIVGEEGPTPLPPGTKLLHTCSCYGYEPPVSGEARLADSKP